MKAQALIPIIAVLATTGGAAQEAAPADTAPGWEAAANDTSIGASIAYSSGIAVAVLCVGGRDLQVLLAGLPEAGRDEFVRTLEITSPTGVLKSSSWIASADPGAAYALAPSRTARTLRAGQPFTVRAPTADGRHVRYELDLPTNAEAVDRVLQACDRPLEEASDFDLVVDPAPDGAPRLDWARRPEPYYPSLAQSRRITQGIAALDCTVLDNGRLSACRIEAELPAGMGFGPAAVQAAQGARLSRAGSDSARGRARFHIRFRTR